MADDEHDPSSPLAGTDLERPFPPADSPAAPLRPGTILAGRYEIGKSMGRGGMGLVVQAFDRTLGVEVAIKIVRAEYAGEREWSERLAREVKLARQIQHANVCRVFEYAQADGRSFLIMELATGGTLRDELHAGMTAARPLAARIADARAIAAGLGAIHAAGIVHRDISPQNALRMSDGRLVLSDFGLATDSFDGTTSLRGGTVAYMAPEVARGGHASFAADLWALGAVIHETVFGQRLAVGPGQGRAAQLRRRPAAEPDRAHRPRDLPRLPGVEPGAPAAQRRRDRRAAQRGRPGAVLRPLAAPAGSDCRGGGGLGRRACLRWTAGRDRPEANRAGGTGGDSRRSAPDRSVGPAGRLDRQGEGRRQGARPDPLPGRASGPPHGALRLGLPATAPTTSTPAPASAPPSPLVPDAYAEGCPDLSRDGKRLVYTGHTPDDRAYAFVSAHPDGRDAVAEVPIAEPSRTSDPVWLPDGQSFLYDIDDKHVGVFSLETRHSEVVPTTLAPLFTSFHAVVGKQIFVDSLLQTGGSDIGGFSFPHLNETVNFHLSVQAMDVQISRGRYLLPDDRLRVQKRAGTD